MPREISSIVKDLCDWARLSFEENGFIRPSFIVGNTVRGQIKHFEMNLDLTPSKSLAKLITQEMVQLLDADFVVIFIESWLTRIDKCLNIAKREEIISCTVETMEGEWIGYANILRTFDSSTFGEFIFHKTTNADATLTNFLAYKRQAQ